MNEVKSNKTYTVLFGDKLDSLITIGNPNISTEFQNHMKIEFWNEDFISFNNKDITGIPTLEGERLSFETFGKTYYWELKNLNQIKWVEVLKNKPLSNEWVLELKSYENFKFCYQVPFAIEAKNIPDSKIEFFKKDNEDWIRIVYPEGSGQGIHAERPLDIDGSYVIKHKWKKNNKYKTGKPLHIPRPRATDAVGKSVLCELNISNGLYTRTTPWDFLDSAVYPVVINDRFGKEAGTSTVLSPPNYQRGFMAASGASAGTADSISMKVKQQTVYYPKIKGYLFLESDDSYVGKTDEWTITEGYDGWKTIDFTGGPSIEASTQYVISANSDNYFVFYFDTDVGGDGRYDDSYTYDGTGSASFTNGNREYAIYCDYTPTPVGMSGAMTTNTGYWGW